MTFQLISIYDFLLQVDEFLKEEVEPMLKKYEGRLQGVATLDIWVSHLFLIHVLSNLKYTKEGDAFPWDHHNPTQNLILKL